MDQLCEFVLKVKGTLIQKGTVWKWEEGFLASFILHDKVAGNLSHPIKRFI
jgi:hypothetical protein